MRVGEREAALVPPAAQLTRPHEWRCRAGRSLDDLPEVRSRPRLEGDATRLGEVTLEQAGVYGQSERIG